MNWGNWNNWGSCVPSGTDVPTLACVPVVFGILINTLLAFVGTAAVIMMIFSGIKMMTARGDAKELDASHKMFFYSIIGLLLVLFSFLIINLIAHFTNVGCITQFGFTNCTNIPSSEGVDRMRTLPADTSGGSSEQIKHP